MAYLNYRRIWEEAHGPIAPGYAVHHRNGDHSNNSLDNLELMPEGAHSRHHKRQRICAARRDNTTGRFVPTTGQWSDGKGHVIVRANGRDVPEHRLIWEQEYGPVPDSYDVHHINGDPADNRLENLTLMPHSEHSSLHTKGRKRSEEARLRISQSKKGTPAWNKGLSGYHTAKHPPRTEETRAKLSAALKGRSTWNKGRPWSAESRQRMSVAHTGQHSSPQTEFRKGAHPSPSTEFKKGQQAPNKGQRGFQGAWNKGVPCPDEMKQRISVSLKGHHPSEETRRKMSEAQHRRYHPNNNP